MALWRPKPGWPRPLLRNGSAATTPGSRQDGRATNPGAATADVVQEQLRYDPTMATGSARSLSGGLVVGDEGRHCVESGLLEGWEESWHFDFISTDGDIGASLRLGRQLSQGLAPVWGCLVRKGHPLVHLVDHEVPLVRETDSIGVRGEGLWADAVCETPFDHCSVGLEAFAIELDDSQEALGQAWGDRIGLGFDLEWETTWPVASFELPNLKGYQMMCRVHGEVLIGSDTLAIDGWGQRQHIWGLPPWRAGAWCWGGGTLDDGTTWQLNPDGTACFGGQPTSCPDLSTLSQSLQLGDVELHFVSKHRAPVLLPAFKNMAPEQVERHLLDVTTSHGAHGTAWLEWSSPSLELRKISSVEG